MPTQRRKCRTKCTSLEDIITVKIWRLSIIKINNRSRNFNDVWMLDFAYGQANWVELSDKIKGKPPKPRHGHTACARSTYYFTFSLKAHCLLRRPRKYPERTLQ